MGGKINDDDNEGGDEHGENFRLWDRWNDRKDEYKMILMIFLLWIFMDLFYW